MKNNTYKNKIGVKFKDICYDIDDISRIWYDHDNGKLKWKLYSDTDDSPYFITASFAKAENYINYIHNYKYSKIIKF